MRPCESNEAVALISREGGFDMEDSKPGVEMIRIFCRYIVKNGKRIYPRKSRVFSFLMPIKA